MTNDLIDANRDYVKEFFSVQLKHYFLCILWGYLVLRTPPAQVSRML